MNKIIICDVICKYLYTLKYFFKNEFYNKDKNVYIIPTHKLLALKRELFPKIQEGHGYVCGDDKNVCDPYKFINYIKKIVDFLYYSVEEEKVFYGAFEFFPDDDNSDFFGWSYIPINKKCIKHLSYSRRLAYLN